MLEVEAHTFFASTEAVASTRDRRQYKGDKNLRPKGRKFRDTDNTDPVPLICRTQSIIGPKHVGRVRPVMDKGIKDLGLK